MAAREGDAAFKRKVEEEDSSPEAADQEAGAAAFGDECPDDEADPVIRNLNLISRRNLMTPGWVENRKKLHYEHHALLNSVYDALENGEIESDSDDDEADAADRSKQLWASVDLSGLNAVDGVHAVAVYPACVYSSPGEEEEGKDHDAAAAAAAAKSSI